MLQNMFRGMRHGTFSSAAGFSSNRAYFWPVRVLKPYPLRRFFWLNGATVGTGFGMMALYDENLIPLVIGQRVLTAGTNAVQYSEPGIGIAQTLAASGSQSDLSTYTTASATMKKGYLYLIGVENSHGTDASAVSAITASGGGAPTFTSRATTQFNGTLYRTSLWSCVPTADYTGTLDIAFGGVTQTGATWSLIECVGVDTATNDGIVQSATNTGNDTTPTVTLSAFSDARNGVWAVHGSAQNGAATPETNWIETGDVGIATPTSSIETQWRADNDTISTATIASAPWGSIAVELKAGPTPFLVPQGLHYLSLHLNNGTDTMFQNSSANSDIPAACYEQNTLNFGLGRVVVPTVSTSKFIICGFTRRATP